MKPSSFVFRCISLLLVITLSVGLASCRVQAQTADLMAGISAADFVQSDELTDRFTAAQINFSLNLFRAAALENPKQNLLLSPLSVQLALCMTANGANGETRTEIERLFGPDFAIKQLNQYLYTAVNTLLSKKNCKLKMANSIWFSSNRNSLTVKKPFLQLNANYYKAQAYQSAFNDQTVQDINHWVKKHTDGMIDKVIDQINPNTVLFLINALAFDAEWDAPYKKSNIFDDTFTALSGSSKTVQMMHSVENQFISDEKATGFIKKYKNSEYSFAALLPNEGIDIDSYIAGLTGTGLLNTLENAQMDSVTAGIPKFSCTYQQNMKKVLGKLGMSAAFNGGKADFSNMVESADEDVYLSDILHKTYITVDELGTKAGAVTKEEFRKKSVNPTQAAAKRIILNRPFIYVIFESKTKLPVFIGAVTDVDS